MRTERLKHPGRVWVEIRGSGSDAFLSKAAAKGLSIRNVRREGEVLCFSARRADMPVLRQIRRSCGVRLRLRAEPGQADLLMSPRKLAGLLLFLGMPVLLSMFIWTVDVAGGTPEREERIGAWLLKQGVTVPLRISSVPDEGRVRNALMASDPGLAWVRVERKGGRLTVHAVEAPEIADDAASKEKPAHLAASRRAVVTRFELTSGIRNVLPNTTVEKGDILASGIVTQGEKSVVTGAKGKVFGDYILEMNFKMPATVGYSILSGRAYKITAPGKRGGAKGEEWRELRLPQPLSDFMSVRELSSSRKFSRQLSEQDDEELILGILREKLRLSLTPGAAVKDEKILRVHYDNDKVEGTVLFLINENIAVRKQISQGD
ncbi:sporulation protein YqfD [Bhargavaea cecembensis]|uniref:sporulation protein YqfD n=1 Tax=Bhargavaea cecembensis TaxID=394098 RepID=UPI0009E53D38|nr:sporulation protein YqfD [Bhargavaea cecembensis]